MKGNKCERCEWEDHFANCCRWNGGVRALWWCRGRRWAARSEGWQPMDGAVWVTFGYDAIGEAARDASPR